MTNSATRTNCHTIAWIGLGAWLFGAWVSCSGCAESDRVPPQFTDFECPAPVSSAEPQLHVRGERLYLSWLVHGDANHTFQYAVYENGTWSPPRTIAAGDSFFANWADVPSLVELGDGSLLAHWLWRSGEDTYAYDVMMSRSTNGVDWQPAFRPHDDGTQTEHGFVSLIPDAGSDAMAVWLDGRDYATKEHGDAEMQLMWTHLDGAGMGTPRPLDTRVCDCCPTNAVHTSAGVLVAYRDRSPEEIRDIYLVRYEDGAWSEPYPLANDGWSIAGCPVNGPALAAHDSRVVAVWYTIPDQEASVRVAFSEDGGRSFAPYVRADDGEPLGRVDTVLLPGGDALVTWLESPPDTTATLRARRVHANGQLDASFVIVSTHADRASGFPRLVRIGNTLYFAWTEIDAAGEAPRVRMARASVPRRWR